MLAATTHPSRVLNLDMKAKALYAKELYLYVAIGGKKQRDYAFIPTSLFRKIYIYILTAFNKDSRGFQDRIVKGDVVFLW